jgi:hypothetical protein
MERHPDRRALPLGTGESLAEGEAVRCGGQLEPPADLIEPFVVRCDLLVDPLSGRVEVVDARRGSAVACQVGHESPIIQGSGLSKESRPLGAASTGEGEEPVGEGLDPVFRLGAGLGVDGVEVSEVAGTSHSSLDHGGISWTEADVSGLGASKTWTKGDLEVADTSQILNIPLGGVGCPVLVSVLPKTRKLRRKFLGAGLDLSFEGVLEGEPLLGVVSLEGIDLGEVCVCAILTGLNQGLDDVLGRVEGDVWVADD